MHARLSAPAPLPAASRSIPGTRVGRARVPLLAQPTPIGGCTARRISGEAAPRAVAAPHRHDFFELFWVETGRPQYESETGRVSIPAGSLVLIPPGRIHAWASDTSFRGYLISFTADLFAALSHRSPVGLPSYVPLSAGLQVVTLPDVEHASVSALCEQLLTAPTPTGAIGRELTRARLEQVLLIYSTHAASAAHRAPETRRPDLSARFLAELEHRYRQTHHASAFARRLGVSNATLAQHVRAQTGKSPAQLIEDRLLLEGRRLLAYTSLSMAEVAYELGFKTPSNFGRFFKRRTGQTPNQARAQLQRPASARPA